MIYVRRMRGRLFTEGEDMTGYETIRLGRVKRSDKPGAVPEFDAGGAGPLLAIQAHEKLSRNINSLIDQIEAKDEVLAREAREHKMAFTDGVSANMEHLLKLHALNEARGHLRAFQQSPMIPPYDVYVALSRLIGHLSVFHEDLVPGVIPPYKHDHPGETFARIQDRIQILLDAMRPQLYVQREFARKKDAQGREGLEVEVDRPWIDDSLEMFVGLFDEERDINELQKHMYSRLNFKLASPTRAPKIVNLAVRGLRLEIKAVPAGTLPRRQGLHYYKINKTMGADRTDYWRECEQERGIRVSVQEGQLAELEQFRPALYVILKER